MYAAIVMYKRIKKRRETNDSYASHTHTHTHTVEVYTVKKYEIKEKKATITRR